MGTKQIKPRGYEDFITSMLESARKKETVKPETPFSNLDVDKVERVANRITGAGVDLRKENKNKK